MLQCITVCCGVLRCVAVCCGVLWCVVMRCRALQRHAKFQQQFSKTSSLLNLVYNRTIQQTFWQDWIECLVYPYIYIHIHIHTHTHTYTYMYIHIHVHTHTCTYTYIHIHIHTHIYIYICIYAHIDFFERLNRLSGVWGGSAGKASQHSGQYSQKSAPRLFLYAVATISRLLQITGLFCRI